MNSPGYISISAVAILASPRPIEPQKGNRNILFDANLFIADGTQSSTMGLLRYFVPDDLRNDLQTFFDESFQKAFVVANVCSLSQLTFKSFPPFTFMADIFHYEKHHPPKFDHRRP